MAGISYGTPVTGSAPVWVGDELKQREHVVEAGGLLQAADFAEDANGRRYVESGTLVGRTYVERDGGRGFGPAAFDASGVLTDTETYLLLHDVYDADFDASATFYRPGSVVYERFLPAVTKEANPLAAVRNLYLTKVGDA